MTAAVVYESTDEWLVGDGGRVPNESKVPPSSGYRHISTMLLPQKAILPLIMEIINTINTLNSVACQNIIKHNCRPVDRVFERGVMCVSTYSEFVKIYLIFSSIFTTMVAV